MLHEDFQTFKTYIDRRSYKKIARLIGLKIRAACKDWFGEEDSDTETDLAKFFAEVFRTTGQSRDHKSDSTYSDLVKNWMGGKSTSLAVETYYYLHVSKLGSKRCAGHTGLA